MEKLTIEQVKNKCDYRIFKFENTKELKYTDKIVAQPRFEKSIDIGLNIKNDNFNIFVLGEDGLGKMTYTKKKIETVAQKQKKPMDIGYVHNFNNEDTPILLEIPAGTGKILAQEMKYVVNNLVEKIPSLLKLESIENKKDKLLLQFQKQRDKKVLELNEIAKKFDTTLKTGKNGIYMLPIIDGETAEEDEIEKLEEKKRVVITNKINDCYEVIEKDILAITKLEDETFKEISKYEYCEFTLIIGKLFSNMVTKYCEVEGTSKYLKEVKDNLVKTLMNYNNLSLSGLNVDLEKEIIKKYKINIVVDNSGFKGAPVINCTDCSVQSLIGEIEYEYENINIKTDFNKIVPGNLQKANGGYLLIKAYDLISNMHSYDVIKRVLETKKLDYGMLKEFTGISKPTININPMNLDFKLIIVGNYEEYSILNNYDNNFKSKFKIISEFNSLMDYNVENLKEFAFIVKKFVSNEKLKDVTSKGICTLVEYSMRIAEEQDRLSTKFNKIQDLLIESNYYAQKENSEYIKSTHIKQGIRENKYRHSMYEKDIDKLIDENIIMINTVGEKIGEVNGISVIDTEDFTFAKPNKISVTTYAGDNGILNIEKESDLSGKIHDKGINIINGYLGNIFAQNFPLTFECRVCFEQNYSEIEGDSASSAELYCILSSLSEIPLKQYIGVTGSVNQKGEIQAVGGVTHKIEGFYNCCKNRGLKGNEGVIIPYQNIKNLNLSDEVCKSIEKEEFHIYAIKNIKEGMKILTGENISKKGKRSEYHKNSVYGKTLNKLRRLSINFRR